jgi:GT2 family glycosyltransferase
MTGPHCAKGESAKARFSSRDVLARLAAGGRAVPRSLADRRLWPVLASAALVDLAATMRQAWIFVRGKRVRGWNGLCALANRHPGWPARWRRAHRIALGAGLKRVVAEHHLPPVRLAALIAGSWSDPAAVIHTARNLAAVLGPGLVAVATETGGLADLAQAGWDWVLVLRPGDAIDAPFGDIARLLAADRNGPPAWFWDCDHATGGHDHGLTLKPDWDPLLDRSIDLLAGTLIVARALFERVRAALPAAADGAALALALAEAVRDLRDGPGHLPAVLGRTAPAAARPAVPPLPARGRLPAVSIIVLTRDRSDLVIPLCAALDQLDYPGPVERIVVDNGSTEPELVRFLGEAAAQGRLRWVQDPGPFNFAALNNRAVAAARGELVCLLNNDVVPLDRQWLTRMVIRARDPQVGAVGAMLTYPDGSIQHAGVAIGVGGAAGHVQRGVDPGQRQWANWHAMSRRVEAVTAACLVMRKAVFESIGGFDETRFPVAFNDVDLCLRLRRAGLHNIYEADARLIHYESASRGDDNAPRNIGRFTAELATLRQRWNTEHHHDRCWSPLFSRSSEQCLLVP